MAMRDVAPGMLAWSVMESPWSPTGYQTARTRAAAREVHVVRPPRAAQEPAGRFLPAGRGASDVGRVDFLGVAPALGAVFFGVARAAGLAAGAFLAAGAALAAVLRAAGFRAGFLTDGSGGAAGSGGRGPRLRPRSRPPRLRRP